MTKLVVSRICIRILDSICPLAKVSGFSRDLHRDINGTWIFTINIGNNTFKATIDKSNRECYKYGTYDMDFRQWIADIKRKYEKHCRHLFFEELKEKQNERLAFNVGFTHGDNICYSTSTKRPSLKDVIK